MVECMMIVRGIITYIMWAGRKGMIHRNACRNTKVFWTMLRYRATLMTNSGNQGQVLRAKPVYLSMGVMCSGRRMVKTAMIIALKIYVIRATIILQAAIIMGFVMRLRRTCCWSWSRARPETWPVG